MLIRALKAPWTLRAKPSQSVDLGVGGLIDGDVPFVVVNRKRTRRTLSRRGVPEHVQVQPNGPPRNKRHWDRISKFAALELFTNLSRFANKQILKFCV